MSTVFFEEEKTLSKEVLRLIRRAHIRIVPRPEKHQRRSVTTA